jgi:phosphonate ABC transporter permease subunit PhnE
MEKPRSPLKSIALGLAVLAALVIYAYGFQVTKVNLDETRSPRRQQQLVRILRALAQPEILEYDKEEFQVNAPIYVPCPAAGVSLPEPDTSGPYMVLTPPCADPGAEITVEGFNFEPNTSGPLNFIPPSGVSLRMADIQTDAQGHFTVTAKLPKRPTEEVQAVRGTTRRTVGGPHFSQNAKDTWDKIVETVFLALLATTLGTAIAVPASFLAARNIMTPITSPLTSVMLSILLFPIGLGLGWLAAVRMSELSQMVTASLAANIGGVIAGPLIVWGAARWALPPMEEAPPGLALRIARLLALLIATLVGLLALFLLANLAALAGEALAARLGALGFLGTFIADLGDILGFSLVLVSALGGGAVLVNVAGRLGQIIIERVPGAINKILNLLLGAAAGATLLALIGAGINWLYQLDNPMWTLWLPAGAGAAAGLSLAILLRRNATLPIGFLLYTMARTVFNGLRSIESLVMVIVFAVWVGIGPFAGVLALALHTIASNAKLYSEQVESIMAGPLEAITATGATRLQTIVYAVIPQIIPPFISYTMYRWDINVRMSTIIGFAGGGGIGFLLQQNINLLNYRAASTQMLAIAVVVATMDYLSTKMRERAI